MEEQLRKAALDGNTQLLREIHTKNPLLLDRVTFSCFNETPLHAAVLRGHLDFVTEILGLNPDLAKSLDSRNSSPLHLASAKGSVEVVQALVAARPEMCEVLDRDGLNPLHVAAAKGKVEVVRVLVRQSPAAARAPVYHLGQTETVLHLCVKLCQVEALKVLMEEIGDHDRGFVNAGDGYGNTILHLAVADKQIETVNYLLMSGRVDVNAKNANGHTALDILTQSRRDVQDWVIGNSLQEAGAFKVAALLTSGNGTASARPAQESVEAAALLTPGNGTASARPAQESNTTSHIVPYGCTPPVHTNGNNPPIPSFLRADTAVLLPTHGDEPRKDLNQGEWLAKKRDALMVVASLLATMAFQAGLNPPGGVWQDNSPPNSTVTYRAGEAVIAYNYAQSYKYYLRANTISFVASLSTILLLISGLPFRRKTFMWILMVIMWLSITTMAFTYSYSIVAITPKAERAALRRTMYVAVPVWCGVMGLLLLGHTLRLLGKYLNGKGIDMWKLCVDNFRIRSVARRMVKLRR